MSSKISTNYRFGFGRTSNSPNKKDRAFSIDDLNGKNRGIGYEIVYKENNTFENLGGDADRNGNINGGLFRLTPELAKKHKLDNYGLLYLDYSGSDDKPKVVLIDIRNIKPRGSIYEGEIAAFKAPKQVIDRQEFESKHQGLLNDVIRQRAENLP